MNEWVSEWLDGTVVSQLSSLSNFTALLETRIIWTHRQRPPWECGSVLAELAQHSWQISAVSSIRTALSPLLSFLPPFPPPLPTKPACSTQLSSPLWLLCSRRCCSFVFAALQSYKLSVCTNSTLISQIKASPSAAMSDLGTPHSPTNKRTGRLSGHAGGLVGVHFSLYLGIYFLPLSSDLFGQL